MGPKKKQPKIYITLVLLVAVSLALNIGIFLYLKSSIQKASLEFNVAQATYEQKDKIKSIKENIESLSPELERLDSFFVDSDDVVSFLDLIESMAEEDGMDIEIKNVSVLESEEAKFPYGETLSVSLSVAGDWNQVVPFIKDIQELPFNTWIPLVDMNFEENEVLSDEGEVLGTEFFWNADITLNVLRHPNNE